MVGPTGRVIGVDLNDDMLALARGAAPAVAEQVGYGNVDCAPPATLTAPGPVPTARREIAGLTTSGCQQGRAAAERSGPSAVGLKRGWRPRTTTVGKPGDKVDRMRTRMTISIEPETAAQIRREAEQDGLDVSTWLAKVAQREATRRAYARVAAERRAAGIDSEDRLAAYGERRAAVRQYVSQEGSGAA